MLLAGRHVQAERDAVLRPPPIPVRTSVVVAAALILSILIIAPPIPILATRSSSDTVRSRGAVGSIATPNSRLGADAEKLASQSLKAWKQAYWKSKSGIENIVRPKLV
jgi:hypothetical protein